MKRKAETNINVASTVVAIVVGIIGIPLTISQMASCIQKHISKITVSDLQAEDLSSVGIYLTPEEACVITPDDSTIYKKGAMLHTLIKNPKDSDETIKECNLVVTSMEKLEETNIVYFPVTFEDSIGIYAVNNGNVDSDEYSMSLMLTFDNVFGENNANIEYRTEDVVNISVQSGEAKEIFNYTFDELDEVFIGTQQNMGWAHIVANINDERISVGNIAKTDEGYQSFINQGGESPTNPIPIYLKYGDKENPEIKNNYPDLPSNSTTAVDFLLLPDESVEVRFYFDITFSNGDKSESSPETVKISVPIYEDTRDYQNLIEYIQKSNSKRMVYDRDDFMDSSFIYDPEKLYSQYLEEFYLK